MESQTEVSSQINIQIYSENPNIIKFNRGISTHECFDTVPMDIKNGIYEKTYKMNDKNYLILN